MKSNLEITFIPGSLYNLYDVLLMLFIKSKDFLWHFQIIFSEVILLSHFLRGDTVNPRYYRPLYNRQWLQWTSHPHRHHSVFKNTGCQLHGVIIEIDKQLLRSTPVQCYSSKQSNKQVLVFLASNNHHAFLAVNILKTSQCFMDCSLGSWSRTLLDFSD